MNASNNDKPLALRDDSQVALTVDPAAASLSVQQVLAQVALIQQIMGAAMKENEHFGKVPGCGDKPTLLKAGAEKLCLTFQLAPSYDIEERQMDKGHREYRIQCALSSILNGRFIGQGVGVCSTMEAKYRYRSGKGEATDKPVPRAYWDVKKEDPAKAQELIGGKGYSALKVDGKGWMIARGGEKIEHDNPADVYNTVLKIAKKRALVDAVLTATAASDCFTQDLEDIQANMATYQPSATAELVNVAPSHPISDFRETRIHFGKNRGLMLSELTPQQVHWYLVEWMPKKEVNGATSVEDITLINALKAYQHWRGNSGKNQSRNGLETVGAPAEERLEEWPCYIQDVSDAFKRGSKTYFTITLERGTEQTVANTFSSDLAKDARDYCDSNQQVMAKVKQTARGGFEVLSLEPRAEMAVN